MSKTDRLKTITATETETASRAQIRWTIFVTFVAGLLLLQQMFKISDAGPTGPFGHLESHPTRLAQKLKADPR